MTRPVLLNNDELPVVRSDKDDDNWTLVTTRRIVGCMEGLHHEQLFNQLEDYVIGLPRSMSAEFGRFRTTDIHGVQKEFITEAGTARIAFVDALRFLHRSVRNA